MGDWPESGFGNWNRWSNDLGTLNLLNPGRVMAGLASVRQGGTYILGRPLCVDPTKPIQSYQHEVAKLVVPDESPEIQDYNDRITVLTHSMTGSHFDALSHLGHRGYAFNGVPYEAVVDPARGALRFAVDETPAVIGRGLFVDVPRLRGQQAMEAGDPVLPDELRVATKSAEAGDILVVRTGAPYEHGEDGSKGRRSGLHVDCMEVVADRDFSVVATDGPGDNFPATGGQTPYPIHVLAEVYLGLPLIHNLDLEDLALAVAERDDPHFLFVAQPLRVGGGSGSPVNPVAVL